jgi:hypothetical protein
MSAASLTKVVGEFDRDTKQNKPVKAVYTFVPSSSYPNGAAHGDPCALSAAAIGWTSVDSVKAVPVGAALQTATVRFRYNPVTSKMMAYWCAAAAAAAIAEVDNTTNLFAVAPVVKVLVVGKR